MDGGAMTSSEGSEPRKVQGPSVGAPGQEVVTKLSPWSVADTVTRLLAAAAAMELKVFAVIDHSGEAGDAGLQLPDTELVLFASPTATAPVMVPPPLAALFLPLKVLVWSADDCQVKLSYAAPGPLARRYGLSTE